ncbi:hypothetical protein [Micromonospora sp. NPDC049204]|uniref:hypothetical protein n=1 Tax=Micromonospora sp. NPDC049204 TaxID=3154351 RepID=UPI0033C04351
MAFRTWGRLLLTALGVSVLAGAGQLGVAYGFGIVRLTGAFTGTTVNQWPAQLVWVGWFAANAAVVGAVLTGRLARSDAPAASTGRQLAIGGAAALGATVIAPLCMQPARAAELISVDPVWAVGICAVLGAVIGAGAAIAVLLRPELGWNMTAVAGVVWLLALISVLPSLGTAGPLPTVRLGVLEPSWLSDSAAQRLALLLLPIVALLAGAATAGLARWRGQEPLISGATGVAGPVLVAFAYLTAGPGDSVDRYQVNPYYGSLIAILAGALGAAAAALLRWPTRARTPDSQAIEPSAILRPLPTGPALPNAASPSREHDPDAAERTDAPSAGGSPAGGVLVGGKVADTTPGPRAADGSDGVRTVPAHWDWPTTTASGQHGATPAAPATSATWLTDPTGEFTAGRPTPTASRDDVTSPAETAAMSAPISPAASSPTSTTAGRATPTDGPAADAPTAPTATGTSGGRSTRRDTTTSAPTSTARTSTDGTASTGTPSAGTASMATPSTSAPSAGTGTAGASAPSAGTGTAGASAPSAGTASIGTAGASTPTLGNASTATPGTATPSTSAPNTATPSTATPSTSTPSAGTASTGTPSTSAASATAADANKASTATTDATRGSAGTTDTGAATTATTGTGGVEPGTADAPLTVKPRRARKPKAGPLDATTKPADSTPGSTTSDEPGAGTAVPDREGRDTTSTPTAEATPTAATSTEAAAPATRTGRTRTPVTRTATGPMRTPVPTTTGPTATPVPTTTGPTKTPVPTTTGPAFAPIPTTSGPAGAPATPAGTRAEAVDPPRTPDVVGTGPTARAAEPAGGSAAAGAGETTSARPAEDGPVASGPDTVLWTPASSSWSVTPAWTVPPQTSESGATAAVPPQASESGATAAEPPTGPDEPTGPAPKPRHRVPLPDLSQAGTWNAFDTTRRAAPTGSSDSSTARPATTVASELAAPTRHPVPAESPVVPGWAGAPTGDRVSTSGPATTGDRASIADTSDPVSTDDPASTDAKVAEQPSRRGRLGGLFRRNRSRSDEKGAEASDATEALPTQDEEFVDWVAGLGKPVSDNEPEQESGRRSLRSTGRHHRD